MAVKTVDDYSCKKADKKVLACIVKITPTHMKFLAMVINRGGAVVS